MKTEVKIQVRAYTVTIRDERSGETKADTIVLDKAHLQAAQLVGMNDEDLIYRTYNRQGYRALLSHLSRLSRLSRFWREMRLSATKFASA